MALQNRLLSPTPASFVVGILPLLTSYSGSIAPGHIAFICLLCTEDGRIIGLFLLILPFLHFLLVLIIENNGIPTTIIGFSLDFLFH